MKRLIGLTILLTYSLFLNAQSTITGEVWADTDNDHLQGNTESLIQDIKFYLLDENLVAIDSILSDNNGAYSFTNIPIGHYYVSFDPNSAPIGLKKIADYKVGFNIFIDCDFDLNARSGEIIFSSDGSSFPHLDLGLQNSPTATISGMAWEDLDGDHIRNGSDVGLAGIEASLFDTLGFLLNTVTSGVDGSYTFGLLDHGAYIISYNPATYPMDYFPVTIHEGSDPTIDSDVHASNLTDTIFLSGDELNMDIGLSLIPPTYTLSGKVWDDANDNHLLDLTENGLNNITVTLLDETTNPISTTATNTSGDYSFSNLNQANYYIQVDTSAFPQGFSFASIDMGSEDIDSDVHPNGQTDLIALVSDTLDIHAGVQFPITYTLSGKIWEDSDNNDLYDTGETGLSGIDVYLVQTSGDTILSMTSDIDGQYAFQNILPADYFVQFDTLDFPANHYIVNKDVGSDDSIDSDVLANGSTDIIQVTGDISTVFLGLRATILSASIRGKSWIDVNKNNLSDTTEIGYDGIQLTLYNEFGDSLQSVSTDMAGDYSFETVETGQYRIALRLESIPVGFDLAEKDQGIDDAIDSDFNKTTGWSDVIDFQGDTDLEYFDFGLQKKYDTLFYETEINTVIEVCMDTSMVPGEFLQLSPCAMPQHGTITSYDGPCFSYEPNQDFIGHDTFCLLTCNADAYCDTTWIILNSKGIIPQVPVAFDDVDTVMQGGSLQLLVLSNDYLNGPLMSLSIVDYPSNGIPEADTMGFLTYTDYSASCDEVVSFTYEVCNTIGCDTATVSLYVACPLTSRFTTGISPNGDGINDAFKVQNVENYPSNRLQVYNRWGNLVYDKQPYDNTWNGFWIDNNTILPEGTYYFIWNDGTDGIETGFIEIRR